jgi:Uma2 family endonuclease
MPQGEHSTIQGELIIAINAVVKPKKVARAFPELRYFTKQDKGAIAFRN